MLDDATCELTPPNPMAAGAHSKPTNADVYPAAEAADAHIHTTTTTTSSIPTTTIPTTEPAGNHISALGGIGGRPRSDLARSHQTI